MGGWERFDEVWTGLYILVLCILIFWAGRWLVGVLPGEDTMDVLRDVEMSAQITGMPPSDVS